MTAAMWPGESGRVDAGECGTGPGPVIPTERDNGRSPTLDLSCNLDISLKWLQQPQWTWSIVNYQLHNYSYFVEYRNKNSDQQLSFISTQNHKCNIAFLIDLLCCTHKIIHFHVLHWQTCYFFTNEHTQKAENYPFLFGTEKLTQNSPFFIHLYGGLALRESSTQLFTSLNFHL